MNKVDRALEMMVIDWLQWNEFQPSDHNLPALALELISKRKQHCKGLEMQAQMLAGALMQSRQADVGNCHYSEFEKMRDEALANYNKFKEET